RKEIRSSQDPRSGLHPEGRSEDDGDDETVLRGLDDSAPESVSLGNSEAGQEPSRFRREKVLVLHPSFRSGGTRTSDRKENRRGPIRARERAAGRCLFENPRRGNRKSFSDALSAVSGRRRGGNPEDGRNRNRPEQESHPPSST